MCDLEQQEPLISRRGWLMAASAVGLALCGCGGEREESPRSAETKPAAASQIMRPAPDLGDAVFPNPAGEPIASVKDVPVPVIPRSSWTTARPNLNEMVLMGTVGRLTVHHSGFRQTWNSDAWKETVTGIEGIRDFHTGKDRQWADIAYHFIVDHIGRVWQGRPLVLQGAHAKLHNEHNLGIVVLGNFDMQSPTAAQLQSLEAFIGFVRGLYHIEGNEIYTHGELVKTGCPGRTLQAFMNRYRKSLTSGGGHPPTTRATT